MSIPSVGHATAAGVPAAPSIQGPPPKSDVPFSRLVSDMIQDTNSQHLQAQQSVQDLVTGKTDNIHEVALSAANADLAFRFVMEIRDRLINSYQEVMRMQV
ncbi:flagellar hook-basal body protein FliE [Maioricimonas rarisocia]|uniref:Flagellar hook-basal body complex protein FliE n=1 Tax=Maioricimonas rarisocia TaxID=2528026 RepID=A0A517ZCN0_9PLAN|nr:flagellar hook-basal body complex protein FliE [Maioricimonas rarisocia]QDU40254.1 flagellar hook-basal body protein FliE [Maioricimonas rarisocia]